MKIEKMNENQIRCTLTREDLESRHMRLEELKYGSEKAQQLFREMMRFASFKFGFDVEDLPVMVEAVPISEDKLILIVTKVPYPDELDARFSNFSDALDEEMENFDFYGEGEVPLPELSGSAKEILDLFSDTEESAEDSLPFPTQGRLELPHAQITRIFAFETLDDVMDAAKVLGDYYHGENDLYRSATQGYWLIALMDDHSPAEFNRVCNVLSEFSSPVEPFGGSENYVREHCSPVLKGHALATMQAV